MLSIIIPAKNEEKYIGGLLSSIKSQSFKDYEIIVADDGSSDRTAEIARKHGASVVSGSWSNPSHARNNGAKIARHDYLLFLDADALLPRHFLKHNLREFIERDLDVATTFVEPVSESAFDKLIVKNIWNFLYWGSKRISPHVCGFCIFVKNGVFKRTNGFDHTIVLAEDCDFVKRCWKINKRYDILSGPRIGMSVRRLDKEGRLKFGLKMLKAGLYRTFVGEMRRPVVVYEFGGYDKPDRRS